MNSFKTIESAREHAKDNPKAVYIVEIEPGLENINPYICVSVDGDALRTALAQKPMPEINRVIRTVVDLRLEKMAADEAKLLCNAPGLKELEAAYNDIERYHREFDAMMENESNDGINPPKPITANPQELAKKYPIAAAYLKAERWELASHYAKSSAGKRAKEKIANGEDYNAALAEMEQEWSEHTRAHAWD